MGVGCVKRLLCRLQLDNNGFGGFVIEILIGMLNRPIDLDRAAGAACSRSPVATNLSETNPSAKLEDENSL
jgi:hypothetical protein